MSKNPRDNRPHIPPTKRVELSEKNIWLRVILIAALLTIAVFAIGTGLSDALKVEPGWNQIHATNNTINCSEDLKLIYDFTDYGSSATAASKMLTNLYTDATERAYRFFSPDYTEEGLHNVAYLNTHVNEVVTVDSALYEAFSQLEAAQNRCLFMAPVYDEYHLITQSETDEIAAENDPGKNPEAKAYVEKLMHYIADPQMISLELLENSQVCLKVSDDYLSFAREQELDAFIDFGWMQNAFIADYIAQRLSDEGYNCGYLVSYDGFTRNLDSRGEQYTQNLFDRQGLDIYLPGVMTYCGPRSIVALRDFPVEEMDTWRYYAYANGDITSVMANPDTGMNHHACESMISWSESSGCAEVLLKLIPVYLTETLHEPDINALRDEGIYSLWFRDETLVCNDSNQTLQLHENQRYTISYCE